MELEGVSEADLEPLMREYLDTLEASLPAGAQDYITPHTSTPWQGVERADAARSKSARVGLLRRTPAEPLASMRMMSVDSAVAAARWALRRHSRESPVLSYCVWGYGRAGRRFAELFDHVVIGTGRSVRRPMLVGCADSEHAWVDERGLEHERISAFKTRNGVLPIGTASPPDAGLHAPCDLLILSGRGAAFDPQTAARVGAKVVIDLTGAIDAQTERALEQAGAWVVPSLIATSGPLVFADLERRGLEGVSGAAARAAIDAHVEELLDRVWALRAEHEIPLLEAVVGVGLLRLAELDEPKLGAQLSASSSESG